MGYQKDYKELLKLVAAGYSCVYVLCDDERPVIESSLKISKVLNKKPRVFSWNENSGLFDEQELKFQHHYENNEEGHANGEPAHQYQSPMDILNFIENYGDPAKKKETHAVFILHDFHSYIDNPKILLKLKEVIQSITIPFVKEFAVRRYRESGHHHVYRQIIITAPKQVIPKELDKLIAVTEFSLPGVEEVRTILNYAIGASNYKQYTEDEKEKIVRASLGLTETEIFNAYTKSMVMAEDKIVPSIIVKEKQQIIKKDGTLEYHEPKYGLGEVGGLHNLLDWVEKRKVAYDERIRAERSLSYPKGILLTGVQGCGKSHSVKAIANFLEMPLVRLDIGAVFNKWVGESESNIRKAIQIAESIAPCVLWIDEIDKAIPDPTSGNSHETSKRVLSTLLTWLQEKESPVFVAATANNIYHLPPELMRKGRFDEIFFVNLPNNQERKEIFGIHLKKYDVVLSTMEESELIEKTEGYSGAEIKELISEANFQSASARQPLSAEYILQEIQKTQPLSVTRSEDVKKIQEWAENNKIRPAS